MGSINNDKRSIKEINRTPQETEDLEELGNNFLKDISNYYKNHLSETKDLHLQVAGNNLYGNNLYKNNLYKSKYQEEGLEWT